MTVLEAITAAGAASGIFAAIVSVIAWFELLDLRAAVIAIEKQTNERIAQQKTDVAGMVDLILARCVETKRQGKCR